MVPAARSHPGRVGQKGGASRVRHRQCRRDRLRRRGPPLRRRRPRPGAIAQPPASSAHWLGRGWRGDRVLRRGGGQPAVPLRGRPLAAAHGRAPWPAPVHPGQGRPPRRRPGIRGLLQRLPGGGRVALRTARRRGSPGPPARRARAGGRPHRPPGVGNELARGSPTGAVIARGTGLALRPPRQRGGTCPLGHGLALAGARDRAQGGPHLCHGVRPHGPLSRVPVRHLPSATPGLDARPLPRALRAHPQAGGRGPHRAHRQHVGGGGLQHPVGRVPGAPDRLRQAVLPRRARRGDGRRLAARRLRVLGGAAPDHAARRGPAVPDPEAVLEPIQRHAPPHVLVGRDRRVAGPHPLPASRHLRRGGDRPRAASRGGQLPRPRAREPLPLSLRLRRRRRRPHRHHARVRPPALGLGRTASAHHGGAAGLLRQGGGGDHRTGRLGG